MKDCLQSRNTNESLSNCRGNGSYARVKIASPNQNQSFVHKLPKGAQTQKFNEIEALQGKLKKARQEFRYNQANSTEEKDERMCALSEESMSTDNG